MLFLSYLSTLSRRLKSMLRDVRLVATQSARIMTRRGTNHPVSFRFLTGKPLVRVGVNGLRLFVDIRDLGVAQPLYLYGHYEPAETAFLRRTLHPGDVVVDVGANVGYFTTLVATLVEPGGRVLAFEPDSYNHQLLALNVRTNRLDNVQMFRYALGAREERADMVYNPYNYGDHRVVIGNSGAVTVIALDTLIGSLGIGRVDLIKVDVQGFECQVLAGMLGILRQHPSLTLLTEFSPHGMRRAGGDPEDFFRTLTGLGFRAAVLLEDGSTRMVGWPDVLDFLPPPTAAPEDSYLNLVFSRTVN